MRAGGEVRWVLGDVVMGGGGQRDASDVGNGGDNVW